MFGDNDAWCRRISDMASDGKEQLLAYIMQSQYYALQLDETTHVAVLAQLLTYVRYVQKCNIEKDILFQSTQPTRRCFGWIIQVLDGYIQDAVMSWDKCVGICTDHSMTWRVSGLVTCVQNLAPLAKWTHCMIHRESLASNWTGWIRWTHRCKGEMPTSCSFQTKSMHSLANWIFGVIGWLIQMLTCFPTSLTVCKRQG